MPVWNSISTLAARIPGFKDEGHVLRSPGNIERPAVYEHKHDRFAGCRNRLAVIY